VPGLQPSDPMQLVHSVVPTTAKATELHASDVKSYYVLYFASVATVFI